MNRARLHFVAAFVLGAACLLAPTVAAAQVPTTLPGMSSVPTTKVLAIGSLTGKGTPADATNLMSREVPATVRLYLAGKIDSWYVRKDTRGVVFLMNVSTVEEAHTLLEALPLGVAGLMKFDLIPIGPLSPLNYLLVPAAAPKAAE
ncbi:MAG: hypothetical protein ACRYF4_10550 [Janthinobacterium lividum]